MPDLATRYSSRRLWFDSPQTWDPRWWHKAGVPHIGGDEWGRRVITVGVAFVGYVSWAWRTCWCQECHEMREQTYRFARERAEESTNAG